MSGVEEFSRLARQLRDEQSAARPVVEELRRNPDAALRDEWMTAGAVRALTAASRDLLEQSPSASAALAERATEMVAALDDDYPRALRGHLAANAWKELANALRYLSDYAAALHALDQADAALAEVITAAHARAVMALARAAALRDGGRPSEALPLLALASAVFEEHADRVREAQCELLAGVLSHRGGDEASAARSYRHAIELGEESGDLRTIAAGYSNLGLLNAETGHPDEAFEALQRGRARFRELHAMTELARADWGVGVALRRSGRFEASIPVLRDARSAFRSFGMTEEAALVGMELAEAYVAVNRRNAARRVLLAAVAEFRAANLAERAAVAERAVGGLAEKR